MLSTKALLAIIFILCSAVALKAGVYYGVGMPGPDFVADPGVP